MSSKEIETRFLDIDKDALITKLHEQGAEDHGEDFLREIVFYDKENTWQDQQKFVRIRENRNGVTLTYKHQEEMSIDGTTEIEFAISDREKGKQFLEAVGLVAFREQEKKRHTFTLDNVTIDIDTWPSIPAYVELEGVSEADIKQVAEKLGFDWSKAIFENAKIVIEKYYHLPVSTLRFFTFSKIE